MILDNRGFQNVVSSQAVQGFGNSIGGILNQALAKRAQQKALGGDQNALINLASRDPNRARAVGGILQNRAEQEELQRQQMEANKVRKQELIGRIAQSYSTANDKGVVIQSAIDSLSTFSDDPVANEVISDLQQLAGRSPEQIDQIMGQALAQFGTPTNPNQFGATLTEAVDSNGNRVFVSPSKSGEVKIHSGITPPDPVQDKVEAARRIQTETPEGIANTEERQLSVQMKEQKAAEQQQSAENARIQAQEGANLIRRMLNHPGRKMATGKSAVIPRMAGTESKDYELLLEQAKAGQFLEAIQQMRGLGQLSNAEGQQASRSQTALDLAQSEEAHERELRRLLQILEKGASRKPGEMQQSNQGSSVQELSDDDLLSF